MASINDVLMNRLGSEEVDASERIVLRADEVVPRFRVMCADGNASTFLPLPDELKERQRRFGPVRRY